MLQQGSLPGTLPTMPIASIGLPVSYALPGSPALPFSPPPTAALPSQHPPLPPPPHPPLPPPPLNFITRLEALETQSPTRSQRGLHQANVLDSHAGQLFTPGVQIDVSSRQASPLCTPDAIKLLNSRQDADPKPLSPKQHEVTVALKDLEQAQQILQSSGTYRSPAGAALATRIGRGKAELEDLTGALAAFYEALRIHEFAGTVDTMAGALLFFELGSVRQQLGDTRAALGDYERSRDIRIKTGSIDTREGRELLTIIEELKAVINHNAAKVLAKWARGRSGRKRAAHMKEAIATPNPLPLPPLKEAEVLTQHIAEDMIPVLMTGSNTHQFFTKRQRCLFEETFRALRGSEVLQSNAVMIGASAHGRAPHGRFSTWPHRGFVFDNVVQEEAFRSMGKDHTLMLTFEERAGDWVIEGPSCRALRLGPKNGSIESSADLVEEAQGRVIKIQTPDVSALPTAEPQQWQGIKSLPEIALVFGGGPRASQLASERQDGTCCTKQMIDGKALLTRNNYPYKFGALFVLAAGGQPSLQIMASGPEQFKPPPVPEEVWEKICNREVVDFFTDKSDADLGPGDEQMVVSYAASILKALECLVQQAAAKKLRKLPLIIGLKDIDRGAGECGDDVKEDHKPTCLKSKLDRLRAELADFQAEREQHRMEDAKRKVDTRLAPVAKMGQAEPNTTSRSSSSRLGRAPVKVPEVPVAIAEPPPAPVTVDGASRLRQQLMEAERRYTELSLEHVQLQEKSGRQELEMIELRRSAAEEAGAMAVLQSDLAACRASSSREAGRVCRQELEITELRESLAEERQAVMSLQSELSSCRAISSGQQSELAELRRSLTEEQIAGGAGRALIENGVRMQTERWSDTVVSPLEGSASGSASWPPTEAALRERDATLHDLSNAENSAVKLPQSLESPSDDILREESPDLSKKAVHFGGSAMFYVDLVSDMGSRHPSADDTPSLSPQGALQQRRSRRLRRDSQGQLRRASAGESDASSDSDVTESSEYWVGGSDSTRQSVVRRVQHLWGM